MKIWRRGHIRNQHKEFLEAHNVAYEPWSAPKIGAKVRTIDDYMFEIAEDDLAWPELKRRIGNEYTYIRTRFTDKERLGAEWCIVWGHRSIVSYRIPRDYAWSGDYFTNSCEKCGVGWKQIAPFRLKGEPKLGKNQFCGFGGGFELLCTPLVLEKFARHGITGFETWPVLLKKKGNEQAQNLKQIWVAAMAEPAIAEELVEHERYKRNVCPVCGQIWHAHYVRGILPLQRSSLKQNVDFQLTNEWFGNDSSARHEILVSQRVVRLILENKWKGAELIPIKVV